VLLKYPLRAGTQWEQVTGDMKVRTRIVGQETVETSAGRFTTWRVYSESVSVRKDVDLGILQFQIQIGKTGTLLSKVTRWFTPGIGEVKRVIEYPQATVFHAKRLEWILVRYQIPP
jgi:hypothetical protein